MNNLLQKIELLPSEKLINTGEVDHADWNYKPILGYIQRRRFRLCLQLLNGNHFNNLLEIGYGSGIFMPQLKHFSANLYGTDIHNQNNEVTETLSKLNIKAQLFSSGAESIPFTDNFLDAVVTISSLEFIENLNKACEEIKRVLKKNGSFFVITPGHSKIVDLGLKILTGKNADIDFQGRRENVIPELLKHFNIEKKTFFPKNSLPVRLYQGLKLSPKKSA